MSSEIPTANLQEIIADAERRYEAFLNSRLVGVTISDCENIIYRANDKFLEIIGHSRHDFEQGKVTWSAITPIKYDKLDSLKLIQLTSQMVTDVFEKEYIHKDGHSVPVVVGAELVSNKPPVNISFAIDMSHQREAEREKDVVISTIGHELKTPLSVLRVQAQLLAFEAASGITQKKLMRALKEFDQHIKELDDTLSHVLMYNKPRMKKHATAVKVFDVGLTFRRVIADVKLITERKIVFDHDDHDCLIEGNETEIREVLSNLINNALKYSPQDTLVNASVHSKDGIVTVVVQDYGIGIKKSELKKIFQRLYQVREPERTYERTSKGLGLYLCREIVKKHGGKIEVHSTVGEGSTFICTFKAAMID